jgi:hypothetical protein
MRRPGICSIRRHDFDIVDRMRMGRCQDAGYLKRSGAAVGLTFFALLYAGRQG